MSRAVVASLLTLSLLIVPAVPAWGGHGGGGQGGLHGSTGFRGHPGFVRPPGFHKPPAFHGHGFHGHFHGRGVIVVGPSFWWSPWWGYPPYYYPPYYYPPQVVVQPAPVIVDEESQSYWYYCPSAKAYYPTTPTCPEVWIKVPPRAP